MLRVSVFQAHRTIFQGTARQVVLPGEEGEVSVLAFHAPMLCVLARGAVAIDEKQILVQGGIARVGQNRVTILSD